MTTSRSQFDTDYDAVITAINTALADLYDSTNGLLAPANQGALSGYAVQTLSHAAQNLNIALSVLDDAQYLRAVNQLENTGL